MNNREVAHLWANQSRESAKGSNFYFEGDTIYSYGSHFPIARHYKGAVLFTTRGYSPTTAKHKSYVRSACSHLTVFSVAKVSEAPCREDVKNYQEEIERLSLAAGRAKNTETALMLLSGAIDEANKFCEHFGFKTRFAMPENIDDLKAKAKLSSERERKQKAAAKAKLERETKAIIQQWLSGEYHGALSSQIEKVYLRVRDTRTKIVEPLEPAEKDCPLIVMETSKGATVPLHEAERAFRFVIKMREKGWHKNGETFAIGSYHLDAVNENGVVAGCHRIAWDEIERFAKTQGWL